MTQQEIIDQQNATITKLTEANRSIENKYSLACKEIDLLRSQLNETWAMLEMHKALSNGLAKGMEIKP